MPVEQNSGEFITLSDAVSLTSNFRSSFPGEIKGAFAGGNQIQKILQQEGCIGIRSYYGYDTDRKQLSLVMVGVDRHGKDMSSGHILDRMLPCPSYCDITSPLY